MTAASPMDTNGPVAAPSASAAPRGSTADSPDARTLWRRGRGPLIGLIVLLIAATALAVLNSGDSRALDPGSAAPNGSRALATLLAQQGVTTTTAHTSAEARDAAGPGTTLLVTRPDAVPPSRLHRLHQDITGAGGRVVLVAPTERALAATVPGVTSPGAAETGERDASCDVPEARQAGSATLGGHLYNVPAASSIARCYPVEGLPSLVTLDHNPGETVILGTPAPFVNEHLGDLGNAALALQLLGSQQELVWYLPSAAEAPPPEDEQSPLALLDDGWRWAALQLAVAALLAALWRMRRLGPLVTERLPVVIRAAETTEGRARLYHQAGARDRAAELLRAAARERLARLTGLSGARPEPAALTSTLTARTDEDPGTVHELLYGTAPADDPALVRLADQLDELEARVNPSPGASGTPPAHRP